MSATSRENRAPITVVMAIAIALVIGWLMAVHYIETHFHYTGKGSRTAFSENIVYSLALFLAVTELAFLRFRDEPSRILCAAAVFFTIAFYGCLMLLILWVHNGANTYTRPFTIHLTLLDYLDVFPVFCDIALITLFFKNKIKVV